jgi:predicted acyl esterase
MSQSEQIHEVYVDHNVPVPMRDGTVLRADVYRPQAKGKFPVIVGRDGYPLNLCRKSKRSRRRSLWNGVALLEEATAPNVCQ